MSLSTAIAAVDAVPRGWHRYPRGSEAHYFIGNRSLCRRFITLDRHLDDSNHEAPGNCPECRAERERRLASERGGAA